MFPISDPKKIGGEQSFWGFGGLIGVCLYSEADEILSQLLYRNWNSLHDISGRNILIVCPKPKVQRRLAPQNKGGEPAFEIKMMTIWDTGQSSGNDDGPKFASDYVSLKIRQDLEISHSALPCLVMFHGAVVDEELHVMSFADYETPEEYLRAFREIVAAAEEVVSENKDLEMNGLSVAEHDAGDLVVRRKILTAAFISRMKKKKMMKSIKKHGPKAAIGLVGALAKLFV